MHTNGTFYMLYYDVQHSSVNNYFHNCFHQNRLIVANSTNVIMNNNFFEYFEFEMFHNVFDLWHPIGVGDSTLYE